MTNLRDEIQLQERSQKVEERKRMLVTASGVQTRNLLYDEKEEIDYGRTSLKQER